MKAHYKTSCKLGTRFFRKIHPRNMHRQRKVLLRRRCAVWSFPIHIKMLLDKLVFFLYFDFVTMIMKRVVEGRVMPGPILPSENTTSILGPLFFTRISIIFQNKLYFLVSQWYTEHAPCHSYDVYFVRKNKAFFVFLSCWDFAFFFSPEVKSPMIRVTAL